MDMGLDEMRERRGSAYEVRISLDGIKPTIWRRLLLQSDTTLHELHRAVQMLFGWYDYHLYRFEVGEREFEAPDEEAEGEDSTKARLGKLGLEVGSSFRYVYDFGDDWWHTVEVEAYRPSVSWDWLPWVIDGARRGPPEDCGGPSGYEEIQELLKQPAEDLDEEGQATLEWLGAGFDPDEFSSAQARHDLMLVSAWGALRRRR